MRTLLFYTEELLNFLLTRIFNCQSTGVSSRNSKWGSLVAAVLILCLVQDVAAQTTTCSATFTDHAGASTNYGNSRNDLTTFLPATAGNKIRVTFTAFDIEEAWDGLMIYNGNSTAAPLISSGLPAGNDATTCPAGSWRGGTAASPGTITSTAADGSLTFVFKSDNSTVGAGWSASVSCVAVTDFGASPWTVSSNGTYTVPTGVSSIQVECWGGGGGGGGARASNSGYGGSGAGGGGGYGKATLTVSPGQQYIINVGKGGIPGANLANKGSTTTVNSGGTGGTSSVTGTGGTVTGPGGGGGIGMAKYSSGGSANCAGGTGPTGTQTGGTGATLTKGGNGGLGNTDGSNENGGGGGGSAGTAANGNNGVDGAGYTSAPAGGAAVTGGGKGGNGSRTNIYNTTAQGAAGDAPGGGGGGSTAASNSTTYYAVAGGAGGAGKIVITYTQILCSSPTVTATTAPTANSCLNYATGGTISVDGGCAVTSRGVYYAPAPTTLPTASNGTVTSGTGTGSFSATIASGLAPNTQYYVRAFAINANGTGYGPVQTFTTGAVPTTPAAITPVIACANTATTFTTSSSATVTPITYAWTLPAGWSGNSTAATISATPNTTGGSISVTATNDCGTSGQTITGITIPAPVAPVLNTITNPN